MSKSFLRGLVAALALNACTEIRAPEVPCQVGSYSTTELTALKITKFISLDTSQTNAFAIDLLSCLGAADSDMRDDIVYESLTLLLRDKKLDKDTQVQVFTHTLNILDGPDSSDGFLKPFAALVFSEAVRADRLKAYLSPPQRENAVQATAKYLRQITDYRGFVDGEGWRHGVAHTSDIILQLSLNPNMDAEQLATLRAAITSQIVPTNSHAYIFGESERLARPLFYMARRGAFTQDNWDKWFEQFIAPAPFATWGEVYKSEAGMAKLHNTKAFLNTIYINATETQNENMKMLLPGARKALITLP